MSNDFGITLEEATRELQQLVEEAVNFMWSEFEDNWTQAERYFAGECDLPADAGRSSAVKTELRDVIRAIMPNLMRIFYQSRKPVEYLPSDIRHAAFIEQQALFVNQLFTACGGYKILYNVALQAAKLKSAPIKVWFEEEPTPQYVKYTALTADEVEQLRNQPDFEVEEVEENPKLGEEGFFDVAGRLYHPFGKIMVEDFPIQEFFVSRNATCIEDARVHGHHRTVTVAEAIEMGLEYSDWKELTGTGPEENRGSSSSRARRGYQTDATEESSQDLLQTEILLTEVYCKFDLDGDGVEERYCFYLGGTSYKYITHHEIEDYCIEVGSLDPKPYTVIGGSISDIVFEKQDNETSILRAIIDNAHIANNPRIAGDPKKVAFEDVMNNAIGAPIKTRGDPAIQVVDIPFTGGALIPFLQYLEQDTEERVGVTKAANGLDPDALQSTDKEAVQNTIALSQGQIELMARNLAETCLIGVFNKLLRLAQRHLNRMQVIRTKGNVVPIDISIFDTRLAAKPNVGLGTASHTEKLQTLNFVLQKQEQIVAAYGMDNPFTTMSQIYNTLEDIVELGGLQDPGRYFNVVTPAMEAALETKRRQEQEAMQKQAMEQQLAMQPMDPGRAMLEAEQQKAQATLIKGQMDAQVDIRKIQSSEEQHAKEMDFKRDQLSQQRVIELRKINAGELSDRIKQEQKENDTVSESNGNTSGNNAAAGSQQ